MTPILRPKYRVAMEQRTYLAVASPDDLVGKPDVIVSVDNQSKSLGPTARMVTTVEPLVGQLPMTEEVKERYLEIRMVETKEVVTVIEILSPANKRAGKGREQYEEKRTEILSRSKFGVFGYFQSRLQGFWSHLFRFRLQKTTYFISENRPNLTQKLDIDRQICIYVNCLARILSQNLKFGSTDTRESYTFN
ncbi:DUF4058 family protein [Chloroflexi bacterium TSY]|nr:DUF4058 family protein [Chloroflexi bacterium TSY]